MKIAFMIPTRDGVVAARANMAVMQSALLCNEKGWEGELIDVIGCSAIPIARAQAVARAMSWGADKLVFLDDDIAFNWTQMAFLIEREEPFITGAYALRPVEQNYEKLTLSVSKDNKPPPVGRMTVVDKAGFGFMRCNRECIEKFIEKYQPPALYLDGFDEETNKYYYDYFPYSYEPYKGRNKLWSADQTFVKRMKAIGYPCFFHDGLTVGHCQGAIVWYPRKEDWEW